MRYRIDLKKEREKRGLTQAQLANIIGVTEKSISKWESGRGQPSYDNMLKICKEYNLDINKIDSVEIAKSRTNKILNFCLVSINALIAIVVILHVFVLKDTHHLSKNSDAILYGRYFETARFKLLIAWFISLPIINMFIPIILRKSINISACISIITILCCMFIFSHIYTRTATITMLINILGVLIILFINYMNNKKYKGEMK